MKKIIIPCVLIISVVIILVNSDSVYLKLQENNRNHSDYYIFEVNAERERNGQSLLEKTDITTDTKYAGNHIYLTQVYVEDRLEMIFFTKAFKNGFLDWEYHTLPFTTTDNIIEEALDEWILN
ncbi:hypothetical protein [Bacillus sinesaloumensis]|uniref:hypothetical protein n=1 Tax=Litchfieldia sinesaloumensis TaxID=1926280 RepID=UPI000988378C|nr:hypothetical protein [Bacillus sinesaloumensis]